MIFRQLFDLDTSTYTYLLADEATREAIIIDPVIEQVERDAKLIKDLGLKLTYALDTHVHADHVTALGSLREKLGCQTVLSHRAEVGCCDIKAKTGDVFQFGQYGVKVLETPGHTNGCMSFVTTDNKMVFTGDALLIRGCGRTDFQQGSAATLYASISKQIFTLPDETVVYPGHDYKGHMASTVGEEKAHNPRLGQGKTEAEFIEIMSKLSLAYPKKIDEALPKNLQCGLVTGETAAAKPWAPLEKTADGILEIAPEWVHHNRGAFRLVDVREPSELVGELGKIDGVENIPLGQLPGPLADYAKDAPLVLLCRSGKRSAEAELIMQRNGFTKVVSMRGGMLAWNQRALPIAAKG